MAPFAAELSAITLRAMRAHWRTSGVVNGIAITVSFAIGLGAISTAQRFPDTFQLGCLPKLSAFDQDRDAFDLVYFGSSFIAHGLDPRVIDDIVGQKSKRAFRSFNLAIDGARGLEVDHMIRTLLDPPPKRLRWVMIEAPIFEGWVYPQWRDVTPRMTYWHSARQTRVALGQLARENWPSRTKLELASLHLKLFAARQTQLGMGPSIFQSIWNLAPARCNQRVVDQARAKRGFSSLESLQELSGPAAEKRRKFQETIPQYIRLRDGYRPKISKKFERYRVDILNEQIQFLESRGITPIYVVPPTLKADFGFRELARESDIRFMFHFADPRRNPELYEPANRWDTHHLTEHGARLWSEMLGRDLPLVFRRSSRASEN